MRSSPLLHPITAWRQHERTAAPPRAARLRVVRAPEPKLESAPPADPDLARGRDAGGPVDEACYPCSCGYFFIAPVSADVTCPHCGAAQAW
jgi:hypothetical protein